MAIRLSEGAVYFKLWLWAGMQSKRSGTMILTRSSSEHDGEQVDSHGDGIEDRQGPQSIRHRVFLQEHNRGAKSEISVALHEKLFHFNVRLPLMAENNMFQMTII